MRWFGLLELAVSVFVVDLLLVSVCRCALRVVWFGYL